MNKPVWSHVLASSAWILKKSRWRCMFFTLVVSYSQLPESLSPDYNLHARQIPLQLSFNSQTIPGCITNSIWNSSELFPYTTMYSKFMFLDRLLFELSCKNTHRHKHRYMHTNTQRLGRVSYALHSHQQPNEHCTDRDGPFAIL